MLQRSSREQHILKTLFDQSQKEEEGQVWTLPVQPLAKPIAKPRPLHPLRLAPGSDRHQGAVPHLLNRKVRPLSRQILISRSPKPTAVKISITPVNYRLVETSKARACTRTIPTQADDQGECSLFTRTKAQRQVNVRTEYASRKYSLDAHCSLSNGPERRAQVYKKRVALRRGDTGSICRRSKRQPQPDTRMVRQLHRYRQLIDKVLLGMGDLFLCGQKHLR